MANLADRREPHSWNPRAVWAAIDELKSQLQYLRSSQNVVGRAAVERGRSLVISGGGGIDVRDGGAITASYPDGSDAAKWGRFMRVNTGEPVYGIAVLDHTGTSMFAAYMLDDPNDHGIFDVRAQKAWMTGMDAAGLLHIDGVHFVEANEFCAIMQHTNPTGFPNFVQVDDTGIIIQAVVGTVRMPGMGTTGAAANLAIDFSNGALKVSVSSRRYKEDIEDLEVDVDQVLALVPRKFRMKDEVEELGDDAPVRVGFIAEEAHELGLKQWVSYDADGEPEAFDYPTFCVAQQAALAELLARVEALEAKTNGD